MSDRLAVNPREIRFLMSDSLRNIRGETFNPEMDKVRLDALKPENIVLLRLPRQVGNTLASAFSQLVSSCGNRQVIPDIRFLEWMSKLSPQDARSFGFVPEMLYFAFGTIRHSPRNLLIPALWHFPTIELIGNSWSVDNNTCASEDDNGFPTSSSTKWNAKWKTYQRAILLEV